jgi:hypothetical protein
MAAVNGARIGDGVAILIGAGDSGESLADGFLVIYVNLRR